jgi:hypothetical protein
MSRVLFGVRSCLLNRCVRAPHKSRGQGVASSNVGFMFGVRSCLPCLSGIAFCCPAGMVCRPLCLCVCVCVCAALHPTPPRTIPAFQLRLARERQTESQIEQTRPDQTRPGRETRSDQTSLRPPHDYWPSRCHVGGADAVWRACQVACQFARLPVCLLVRSSACLHGCLSACLSVRPAH